MHAYATHDIEAVAYPKSDEIKGPPFSSFRFDCVAAIPSVIQRDYAIIRAKTESNQGDT
jgi:hypothetical protein